MGVTEWDGVERRTDRTSGAIIGLTDAVSDLSAEVKRLRREVTYVDAKRKQNLIWLIPIAALIAYGYYDRGQIKDLAERERKQSLGSAVAVCAMQNVIRIEVSNFIAEVQNRGVLDAIGDSAQALAATEARRAFLTEARKKFDLVPCEALVQGEEVKIELQYPPTVPVTVP